ncbi:MAG: enoyl-CoA hydratase/isomerase family protein [Acidisphaera sp.]|nr:enoyl-CoA hydratase/isomerase family protein [Acidisphaera sp.]
MADDDWILTEIDDSGIAVVTLNRPAKRNAIALAMWQRLGLVFRGLDADQRVRVVVLTGAGGHFSGGADIAEFATVRADDVGNQLYDEAADATTRAIRDCGKPTIAAVHGFGVGGGCGLALACDLRVGDATTRMGIPAAQRGLVYGPLDTSLVLRQIGLAKAKLVLFTARIFPLQDCLAMGLIDIVGEEGALPEAIAQARIIAGNAPLSVRGSKIVIEALARGEAEQRAAEIDRVVHAAVSSEDFREASVAFTKKRPARFVGR